MKKNKLSKKVVVPLLSVSIILIIVFSFGKPVKTLEAHHKVYEDKFSMKGIYYVDESVVHEGEITGIKLNYRDGEKISKGAKISGSIISPEAGILISSLDGFENKYTKDNIKNIDDKFIDEMVRNTSKHPGIKVLNNSQWFLCLSVDKEGEKFSLNRKEMEISIKDKSYLVSIVDRFENSTGQFILVRMKNDMDIMNLRRGFEGYIIKSRHNGVLLPASAVIERNGEKGILVEEGGYAYFRRVKLFTSSEDSVVVYSEADDTKGIKEYDKVILNPSGLNAGDKVR